MKFCSAALSRSPCWKRNKAWLHARSITGAFRADGAGELTRTGGAGARGGAIGSTSATGAAIETRVSSGEPAVVAAPEVPPFSAGPAVACWPFWPAGVSAAAGVGDEASAALGPACDGEVDVATGAGDAPTGGPRCRLGRGTRR